MHWNYNTFSKNNNKTQNIKIIDIVTYFFLITSNTLSSNTLSLSQTLSLSSDLVFKFYFKNIVLFSCNGNFQLFRKRKLYNISIHLNRKFFPWCWNPVFDLTMAKHYYFLLLFIPEWIYMYARGWNSHSAPLNKS